MAQNLAKLEALLGYQFKDLKLLERAVTHRSWAYENMPKGSEEEIRDAHNESLEFVGDSVLGLAIAEQLYKKNPSASEGDLSLMKHHIVCSETLAKIAAQLRLGEFLSVGRGEEKTGGRRKQALLANALEAVIAAVFFDSGYVTARAFVNRIFAAEVRDATPRGAHDFKSLLQETLQGNGRAAPSYRVIKTEGPPHNRTFFVEAVWDAGSVEGVGNSRKAAEMMAASLALESIAAERGSKRGRKN